MSPPPAPQQRASEGVRSKYLVLLQNGLSDATQRNGPEVIRSPPSCPLDTLGPALPAPQRPRRSPTTDVWHPEWTFAQLEHAHLLHAPASVLRCSSPVSWIGNAREEVSV